MCAQLEFGIWIFVYRMGMTRIQRGGCKDVIVIKAEKGSNYD